MSDPGAAMLLAAASLVVGLVGVRTLVASWVDQGGVVQRSALETVERRAGRISSRLNVRLRRTAVGHDVETRLAAAGMRMRVVDFLSLAAAAVVVAIAVGNTVLPMWLSLFLGAAALRTCWAWLEHRRNQRRERFISQLPDVARILSNASAAGLAMRTAISMAADELEDPAASELRAVADEMAVGQTTEGALANLERRMPSRDVGVLISTLAIQQRAGGDLVHALREMAATLDRRRDLRREIRTMLAGVVFTGYIVAVMGAASLLLLEAIGPGVIERMADNIAGQVIMVTAGILYAVGFLMIRKITEFHV
ncbi:MAG TPA: type II secretion system F family protein [Actinomycetota bacterium]|nr:type II secretion system F family protein [Actinomycetota bacterium]